MARGEHFLFGPAGESFLRQEYEGAQKSTYLIAAELGVYPNLVRRALVHHGVARRGHPEAQRLALEKGRAVHPSRGKARRRLDRTRNEAIIAHTGNENEEVGHGPEEREEG